MFKYSFLISYYNVQTATTSHGLTVRLINFLAICLILLAFTPAAHALPQQSSVAGGLLVLPLDTAATSSTQVYYHDKRAAVVKQDNRYYALVGLPLDSKPGKDSVEIRFSSTLSQKMEFKILPKQYQTQRLTVDSRTVEPSPEDMKRIEAEKIKQEQARIYWSETDVQYGFITPVSGPTSSIFGLRRVFNNQPRNPHSGLDIAAPEGTPILAVEAGTVIEADNFFFSGNVVYIDHGQGLITMYAHMHDMTVKKGDKISRGQLIGHVGQTGRVTGPHLHLGVILNQTLVDPVLFLPANTLSSTKN